MNDFAIDQLSQQIEASRARLASGAADLPDAVVPLWQRVKREIAGAMAAHEPVKAQVRRIWGQRGHTVDDCAEQAQALIMELNEKVNGRLEAADKLLGEIAYQLQEGVNPGRPDGATQVEVIDRKEDIRRLLEKAPSVEQITRLMTEAILAHDRLTAYVLSPGGPLEWTYRTLGIDRPRLRSALFRAIRQASHESVPGEGLLACYEASHEDMTSWTALRTAIGGLTNAVAEGSNQMYRSRQVHGMGQGTRGDAEAQRVEQRATSAALADRQAALARQDRSAATVAADPSGVDLEAVLEASRAPRI